jgi:hypothetical protein
MTMNWIQNMIKNTVKHRLSMKQKMWIIVHSLSSCSSCWHHSHWCHHTSVVQIIIHKQIIIISLWIIIHIYNRHLQNRRNTIRNLKKEVKNNKDKENVTELLLQLTCLQSLDTQKDSESVEKIIVCYVSRLDDRHT